MIIKIYFTSGGMDTFEGATRIEETATILAFTIPDAIAVQFRVTFILSNIAGYAISGT